MKNHPPTIVALTTLAVALAPAVAQALLQIPAS